MQKLLLPFFLVPALVIFPASKPPNEVGVRYSQITYQKPLQAPKMVPVKALELAPLPLAPQGTYSNTYAFGNCTWYVAGRKHIPNSWGNAATWSARARAEGKTISNVPVPGAIAQRAGGLGHVAIVLEATPTMVHVAEMNSVGFNQVDDRWQPISTYEYIYV